MNLRNLCKSMLRRLVSLFGMKIHDQRTGKFLGKAFLLPWRGKVHVLGLQNPVCVAPLPQQTLNYSIQEIGFSEMEEPEIQRRPPADEILSASSFAALPARPLVVLLDHRSEAEVLEALRRWSSSGVLDNDLLLLYAGRREDFSLIRREPKIFLPDPAIRTVHHQRQRQSYRAVLSAVAEYLKAAPHTHVLFVENDQIPLVSSVPDKFLQRMLETDADVLACGLRRIDACLHPHWLYNTEDTFSAGPEFCMLGTGHFWKREAWVAVAADTKNSGRYLEIDLATSAFQAGFRLVGLKDQDPFVTNSVENLLTTDPAEAVRAGAWTLHPVKSSPGAPPATG